MQDKKTLLKRKMLFKATTKKLKQQARHLAETFDFQCSYDIVQTVLQIRAAFRNPDIRKQILIPEWQEINFQDARYSEGFCSVASYVIAHAFRDPNRPSPWEMRQFKDAPTFGVHVWLRYIPTGEIFDITADQFTDFQGNTMTPPYKQGRPVQGNIPHEKAYEFAELISPELAAAIKKNTMDM